MGRHPLPWLSFTAIAASNNDLEISVDSSAVTNFLQIIEVKIDCRTSPRLVDTPVESRTVTISGSTLDIIGDQGIYQQRVRMI